VTERDAAGDQAAGPAEAAPSLAETPEKPAVTVGAPGPVLAVFAHADDAEISAGGTLARWCAEGREVHLTILTNGDRGSNDPNENRPRLARTRVVEANEAGTFLGLASVLVMDVHDGELQNTDEVRERLVRRIREVRPAIVVSCDPTAWFFGNTYYNHSDHRTAGAVALDAVFPGAGNPLFYSEQIQEGLEAHNVGEVWLGWTLEANHHQDVSGYMERKLKALSLHASQVQGGMIGMFEEWLPKEAAENGRRLGVEHAEAFRVLNLT
jgi:LmbE family N-acetylglucosaminyl deacetylase